MGAQLRSGCCCCSLGILLEDKIDRAAAVLSVSFAAVHPIDLREKDTGTRAGRTREREREGHVAQ